MRMSFRKSVHSTTRLSDTRARLRGPDGTVYSRVARILACPVLFARKKSNLTRVVFGNLDQNTHYFLSFLLLNVKINALTMIMIPMIVELLGWISDWFNYRLDFHYCDLDPRDFIQ